MKVTVLMSVFNDEKYIEEAIESVLNQTYSNFDFIIYDDNSTDNTVEILKYYAKKDSRIKLVLLDKNRGLAKNLDEGVKKSQTELIARMDGDDICDPYRIEKQVLFMKNHPRIDILGTNAFNIDADGNKIEIRKVPENHNDIAKLIWANPIIHPSVMFRKSSILGVGSYNPDLIRRQDYELWFRCLEKGCCFHNLSEPLIQYRMIEKEFYQKNDLSVQWIQLKIGIRGVMRTKSSLIGLIAVCGNFLVSILPPKLRIYTKKIMWKFDPRKK